MIVKKNSIIFVSMVATIFMSGCGDKSTSNRQVIHEESADETILTQSRKSESTKTKEIEEHNISKKDNNASLSIPPELLNSTRKRVIPKPMPNMPPELRGMKKKVDVNKTVLINKGPDGIELPKERKQEPLSIPPELLDNKTK